MRWREAGGFRYHARVIRRRLVIRSSLLVIVCLFLGAATTVGIAWSIRRWLPDPWPVVAKHPAPWPVPVPKMWRQAELGYVATSVGRTDLHAGNTCGHGGLPQYVYVTQTGWPWRAMHTVRWPPHLEPALWPRRDGWNVMSLEGGLVRRDRKARLPLAPLWPGFALDAALYSGLWWLLLFGPLAWPSLRGRLRVSRGRCPSCGYDLKGSPAQGPCPECGRSFKN